MNFIIQVHGYTGRVSKKKYAQTYRERYREKKKGQHLLNDLLWTDPGSTHKKLEP